MLVTGDSVISERGKKAKVLLSVVSFSFTNLNGL